MKKRHLCFCCLNFGHSSRNCRRKKKCSINGCERYHHPLLHQNIKELRSNSDADNTPAKQSQSFERNWDTDATKNKSNPVLSCQPACTQSSQLLFRILPVTIYGPNRKIATFALLDEGSSITMIDNELLQELGLTGKQSQLDIQWFGGITSIEMSTVVNVCISGDNNKKYLLKDVYGVTNLNLPMQTLGADDIRGLNMSNANIKLYNNAIPKILIGLDNCQLGLPVEANKFVKHGPIAAKTALGWVIFGPTKQNVKSVSSCLLLHQPSNLQLHSAVEKFFDMENFGVNAVPEAVNEEDSRAIEILNNTTKKINNNFQVGLLWREKDVHMPESYKMAEQRLIGSEKKIKRNPAFGTAYNGIISSYINN